MDPHFTTKVPSLTYPQLDLNANQYFKSKCFKFVIRSNFFVSKIQSDRPLTMCSRRSVESRVTVAENFAAGRPTRAASSQQRTSFREDALEIDQM